MTTFLPLAQGGRTLSRQYYTASLSEKQHGAHVGFTRGASHSISPLAALLGMCYNRSMYVAGHVAASLLASRHWDLDVRLAVAAALFPDVVDKTCHYALGLFPSGRMPTHTFLALALTSGGTYLLGRYKGQARRWATAWAAGYVLHLLFDFAAPMPFLWPFVSSGLESPSLAYVLWHPLKPIEIASLALEIALVAVALQTERRRHRRLRSLISPRY